MLSHYRLVEAKRLEWENRNKFSPPSLLLPPKSGLDHGASEAFVFMLNFFYIVNRQCRLLLRLWFISRHTKTNHQFSTTSRQIFIVPSSPAPVFVVVFFFLLSYFSILPSSSRWLKNMKSFMARSRNRSTPDVERWQCFDPSELRRLLLISRSFDNFFS